MIMPRFFTREALELSRCKWFMWSLLASLLASQCKSWTPDCDLECDLECGLPNRIGFCTEV